MSTGTVQNQAPQALELMTSDALQMSFAIDNGGNALVPGQTVSLRADGTIEAANAAGDFPIGTVVKGDADGGRATVRLYTDLVLNGVATTGDLVSGNFVRQSGSSPTAEGYPGFRLAASTEIAAGIVIKGATNGNVALIAIIQPFVVA